MNQFALTPLHTALKAGAAQTLPVLVRLTAPDAETTPTGRPRLNVALVIDASPSMGGQPLEQAKQAALTFIDRLGPDDRLAVVAYATEVRLLCESAPVRACRDLALRKVSELGVLHGGTNLHGGWLHGAQAIAPHVAPDVLSRVILLSDGVANSGQQNTDILANEARQLLENHIVTSTYGLGLQFNEDLMTRLAQGGGGQAFYAQDAGELAGYFDTEFRLMTACVGRQVEAVVTARDAAGHNLPVTWKNARGTTDFGARLGDLVAGSVAWGLIEVAVPELKVGETIAVTAQVRWRDSEGAMHTQDSATTLKAARRASKADAFVEARVSELAAAELQRQARTQAAAGDLRGTRATLTRMSAMAASTDNAYINAVASNLEGMLARGDMAGFQKESLYSATAMTSRLVSTTEDSTTLSADPLGLRKAVQGKSSSAPL